MKNKGSHRQHQTPEIAQPDNARALAFLVLDEHKRTETFVAKLLEDRRWTDSVSPVDQRLASEMIFGVVRRKATLDALLAPHVTRPRHRIEGALWTLMQLGVYQLTFLASVPAHAAVHETVEVAKHFGSKRWTGFLNGVLRSVEGSLSTQFVERPAEDAVPISEGRYLHLHRPVFANPGDDERGYFSKAFSFPSPLAQRWLERFGFDELCRVGFWFNQPPPVWLRVNFLKTDRPAFLKCLDEAGLSTRDGEALESILLERSKRSSRIDELPGFAEGWFAVQDPSAMAASRLLAPEPGQTVLDLCAAPGTKTTHLAELMNNRGTIVATDVSADRLKKIDENSRRLGIEIIETRQIAGDGSNLPAGPFDAVLVDAPCSNTGVLGKRPEARWRVGADDIHKLAAMQVRLLNQACDVAAPGGKIVYSTCSIEPEENSQVVRAVLSQRPDFHLEKETELVPGRPSDGGYQSLLCRSKTTV